MRRLTSKGSLLAATAVNHSSAGALWAMSVPEQPVRRCSPTLSRFWHHSGLPDWSGEGGRTGLKDRLADRSHLTRPSRDSAAFHLGRSSAFDGDPKGRMQGLWVRMFASALFDADFLDAESILPIQPRSVEN